LNQSENQVVNPSSGIIGLVNHAKTAIVRQESRENISPCDHPIRLLRKHGMLGTLELQSRAHQNGQHCEAKEPLLILVTYDFHICL
jgi:hypothetical protein